jgi:hypothetical protein
MTIGTNSALTTDAQLRWHLPSLAILVQGVLVWLGPAARGELSQQV